VSHLLNYPDNLFKDGVLSRGRTMTTAERGVHPV
jgi:hypothetical protein